MIRAFELKNKRKNQQAVVDIRLLRTRNRQRVATFFSYRHWHRAKIEVITIIVIGCGSRYHAH